MHWNRIYTKGSLAAFFQFEILVTSNCYAQKPKLKHWHFNLLQEMSNRKINIPLNRNQPTSQLQALYIVVHPARIWTRVLNISNQRNRSLVWAQQWSLPKYYAMYISRCTSPESAFIYHEWHKKFSFFFQDSHNDNQDNQYMTNCNACQYFP